MQRQVNHPTSSTTPNPILSSLHLATSPSITLHPSLPPFISVHSGPSKYLRVTKQLTTQRPSFIWLISTGHTRTCVCVRVFLSLRGQIWFETSRGNISGQSSRLQRVEVRIGLRFGFGLTLRFDVLRWRLLQGLGIASCILTAIERPTCMCQCETFRKPQLLPIATPDRHTLPLQILCSIWL